MWFSSGSILGLEDLVNITAAHCVWVADRVVNMMPH